MNENLYILLKSISGKDNNNNNGDDDEGNNGLDNDANNNKTNVSSNVTQNISNTNIMSEEEIQQLFIEWNDTECQCYYLEEKLNTRVTLALPTPTTTTTKTITITITTKTRVLSPLSSPSSLLL